MKYYFGLIFVFKPEHVMIISKQKHEGPQYSFMSISIHHIL
jgi:hypothetical protein